MQLFARNQLQYGRWRVSSVKACVTEYLRKRCDDPDEVVLDNDDDKDDDDNDANSKGKALTMFDRLVNLEDLSKEERNPLVAMKLGKIKVLNKKQIHVNDYFMLE